MSKKKVVTWVSILILSIIIVVLLFHYVPVWTSISVLIGVAVGIIIGWISHILYNKYIKE